MRQSIDLLTAGIGWNDGEEGELRLEDGERPYLPAPNRSV